MRPTRLAVGLGGVVALLGLLASIWPASLPVMGGGALGVVLLLAVEVLRLRRQPLPALSRRLPHALALGEPHDYVLRIENPTARPLRVELHDEAPVELGLGGWPQRARVPARSFVELRARLKPSQRGLFELPAVRLALIGGLGLADRVLHLPLPQPVKVLPDFKAVARYALLGVDRRNAALGVHLRRRRGTGMEFHQLRDFREGDSLRQIDWKAVSRRERLISRDYREESDQQVILMLDMSRRMRALDGPVTHFDRVLDAALLLAWVALRQGDAVGVQTWSGPDRWLPPQRGGAAMNTLLDRVFELQPTLEPSDPAQAARRLASRQKRRALVILLTNLRDDDATALPAAFAPLRGRHLVLVASLREAVLDERLKQPAESLDDALTVAATFGYLESRQAAHAQVRRSGMHVLDVTPSELPAALVRRYMDFKRAGVL